MQGNLQVSHSCWKTLSGVGPFEAATSWNEKKMKRHLFSWKKMRWTSIIEALILHISNTWSGLKVGFTINQDRSLHLSFCRFEMWICWIGWIEIWGTRVNTTRGHPFSLPPGDLLKLNSSSMDLRPRGLKINTFEGWKVNAFFDVLEGTLFVQQCSTLVSYVF